MDRDNGLTDQPDDDADAGNEFFFAQCPDPEHEHYIDRMEADGSIYLDFEDVQTIATLRHGHHWTMRFPQVVLVCGPDGRPARMIRLEYSTLFGTQMLCVLEQNGQHLNLGP
ncbi:MAG: hypothetical protein NZ555_13185, partial [Geminicoccaceae bacterium]|nr:hypothetical protein [Geminicoccaceae bacterium]